MPTPLAATSALCPPGASALGVGGLGTLCQAAGLAGSAASSVAGFGADGVLGALGNWVSEGAAWLLDQVGAVLTATTSIDLGASWFTSHYQTMAALCGVVIVPLLLFGVVQAIYRQDLSMLLRSVVVNVPLALLLTAVAVKLVQLALTVTDDMSSAVAQGAGLDSGHFITTVAAALSGGGSQPAVPAFIVFLGGIAVVAGAFLVWIELLVRAAAVYVAVLFLPLALASLAWPAIAHWCRRLVDTLAALILGKFVIVAVLSLAAGALNAGTGGASGTAGNDGQGGGNFADVLGGAALLLLAALAPWALFRLLPFLEAGAVAHLEGLSQRSRQAAKVPMRGLAQTALRVAATSAMGGPAGLVLGASSAAGGLGGVAGGAAAGGPSGGSVGPSRTGSPRSPGPADGAGATGGRGVSSSAPGPGGRLTGPFAQRSSASSGAAGAVGVLDRPEANIPRWAPDPDISELARSWSLDEPAGPAPGVGLGAGDPASAVTTDPLGSGIPAETTVGPTARPGPASGTTSSAGWAPVPLPRQSGVQLVDGLERDELGIRLVSHPLPTGRLTLPAAVPGHGPGRDDG